MLTPVLKNGALVCELPSAYQIKDRLQDQLKQFAPRIKLLSDPDKYLVGLERSLYELKAALIQSAKK